MKPIKLTPELIEEMKKEIIDQINQKFNAETLRKDAEDGLRKIKMSDGEFKFSKEFKYEKKFKYEKSDRRVTIVIDPVAYAKMTTIIMSESQEVGWHGISERKNAREFLIKDILVYPQQVTASTVDTDEEEYAKWLIQVPEEHFNDLHFHGHSHVNMGVFPSATDMGHREKITSQLGDEDYYIFMIWNKKLEWSAAVYDMASNTLYETADVDVKIPLGDMTAGDLLKDLESKVTQYVYRGTAYTTGGYNTGAASKKATPLYPLPASASPASTPTTKSIAKEENGIGNDPDDFRPSVYNPSRGYDGYDGYGVGGRGGDWYW